MNEFESQATYPVNAQVTKLELNECVGICFKWVAISKWLAVEQCINMIVANWDCELKTIILTTKVPANIWQTELVQMTHDEHNLQPTELSAL